MDLHVERISKNGIYLFLNVRFFIRLDFEYINEYGIRDDVKMGI